MGPFGVNVKEDRGNVHGVLVNDHREDSEKVKRWDMVDARSRRHTRGIGNPVD